MPKYKPCNYDQMVMLPISLEAQLVPGSLEYTINKLVEKHIDLSVFDARNNNDETGATAIHPKILLKIILLAYCRGMQSSRQMERACLENITFMAMACGYTPDHSTIAAFVSSMQEEVKSVFYHARPEDCTACPTRDRCLSKSTASRRYLSVQVEEPEPNVLDKMRAKIDSTEGKQIYARRLGIVEPIVELRVEPVETRCLPIPVSIRA